MTEHTHPHPHAAAACPTCTPALAASVPGWRPAGPLVIVDDLASYHRGGLVDDGGPTLARRHPGEQLLTRQQIARAYAVPLVDVDPARLRAELALRRLEGARWHDDGGPAPAEQPAPVEIRADGAAFIAAVGRAAQNVFDVFRQLAAAIVRAGRWLTRALGRWRTAVPPRRWRDRQPSSERRIDRARGQHLDRQLRTLDRRATRRARRAAARAAR